MSDFEAAPFTTSPEFRREIPPQLSLPGFDLLPQERQRAFLRIPPSHLDAARPLVEAEIAQTREKLWDKREAQAELGAGRADLAEASSRESLAETAIDTFHRAEQGDPEARKDLEDQKKELLDEEPDDEEIFETILESECSAPFAQDLTLDVMLTDPEAKVTQKVLDLFQDYRGDRPSVDDALSPDLQIELFKELTKGKGDLAHRFDFARKALDEITADGTRDLEVGLKELGIVKHHVLDEEAIMALRPLAERRQL